jgi:hypothetical protein
VPEAGLAGGASGESGTGRLLVFTALGAQATGGSDQSAVTFRCFVIGPAAREEGGWVRT